MRIALGIAVGVLVSVLLAPSPAKAAAPCCGVTAIDTRTGVVAAQDKASKRRFEFKVDNATLLKGVRVGQAVDADFQAGKASIEGVAGRHAISGAAQPATAAKSASPLLGQPSSLPGPARGAAPSTPLAPSGDAAPPGPTLGAAPTPAPSKGAAPPTALAKAPAQMLGAPQGLLGQRPPGASSAPATSASAQASLASQGATTQVNPEVIGLKTTPDLVARDLGFTGLGEITFNLVNRGEVGINVPKKQGGATTMGAQATSSGPPISIDIYMGTSKILTVQQPSIIGKQTKNFQVTSSNYSKPKCLETRNL